MTITSTPINPFYAARIERSARRGNEAPVREIYARLPLAPRNASPVPHLTSLYHFHRAGEYGDRKWPGNCGGNLIKDLLLYFRPGLVFDPMTGSGTARDVCQELGVPCFSFDIHEGFDACDAREFPRTRSTPSGRTHPTGGRSSTPTTLATSLAPRPWSTSSAATASSSAIVPRP